MSMATSFCPLIAVERGLWVGGTSKADKQSLQVVSLCLAALRSNTLLYWHTSELALDREKLQWGQHGTHQVDLSKRPSLLSWLQVMGALLWEGMETGSSRPWFRSATNR